MIDITEDLRLYKELNEWNFKDLLRRLTELPEKPDGKTAPIDEDPRAKQYWALSHKLKQIALNHDSVSITDGKLHRVFNDIKVNAFDEEIGEDGSLVSDDYFYELVDRHRPEHIARNLADTKPLTSPTHLVPPEVESLISETREAYSLELPTACISLCRSTVERVIVDIAVRCGRVEDDDRLGRMGMCDRISLLIDRTVSQSSPLRQQINEFMAATSNVIHSNTQADMASALKLYHDAINLIQALYGSYKAQFKR